MKKTIYSFILFVFILFGCQNYKNENFKTTQRINNFEEVNSYMSEDFVFKKERVRLIGVIELHDQGHDYRFFLPDDYKMGGCLWKNIPLKVIDILFKKMNHETQSLWVEVKCTPRWINMPLSPENPNSNIIHTIAPYSSPIIRLDNVKIVRIFIGNKCVLKKINLKTESKESSTFSDLLPQKNDLNVLTSHKPLSAVKILSETNKNYLDEIYENILKEKRPEVKLFEILKKLPAFYPNKYLYTATNHNDRVIYTLSKFSEKNEIPKKFVPLLIANLDRYPFISNTVQTADLLKKITGIDVGWNSKFINFIEFTPEEMRAIEAKKKLWLNWVKLNNK